MRFSCDKSLILKEISIAQEIIESRNVLSILSNVLLETKDDVLTIKATDLKVGFETRIPVEVETEGRTTTFCDKLLNILRSFPNGPVHFVQEEKNHFVITDGKNINFWLNSISADKFPEIPQTDDSAFLKILQKEFIQMVSHTVFAVSDDETRYFMNGVYVEKSEDRIVMVATDGRRLSFISSDLGGEVPDFGEIIVPPKAILLLKKLASGEGLMDVAVADKNLFLRFDNQKITSTLIDGQFPNYKRVIPESQDHHMVLKRESLLDALRRVSLLAEQRSKRIFFTVTPGKLNLKSEESEIGMAEENVECQYEGPELSLALNHVYITEPLRVMKEDMLRINFTSANKAITIVSEPESSFFHIVMPMQND